jgi:hypothetical protein
MGRDSPWGKSHTSWFGHICDDKTLAYSDYSLVTVILIITKGSKLEMVGIGLIHNDVWRQVTKVRENIQLE